MTLKELATRVGLSVSTVSRALKVHADVAAETREHVIGAARTFRYTPNAAARRLITGRAHAVGYVLPLPEGRFADPFFMESVRRVAEMVIARLASPEAPSIIELWPPDLALRASHDADIECRRC